MSSAATAAKAIITRSASFVPIHAISHRLAASAPTMAPTVLAAYTRPTSRPPSRSPDPMPASASGKLAPHSSAAGSTTQRQRSRSISNWKRGVAARLGFTGQKGSICVSA